ncbi:MAG: hypothetical protein JSS66_06675 [Armatimonadetes bacterium]|nr:hypothetical protein [Armatimonadota bacterium]
MSAATNKAQVVRLEAALLQAGFNGPEDYASRNIHRHIAHELASRKIGVVLQLNTGIANQQAWRIHYAEFNNIEFTPDLDVQLKADWGKYTNVRKGIAPAFWEPMKWLRNQIIRTFEEIYLSHGLSWQQYGMVEDENEAAWVDEAEIAKEPGYAIYGTFTEGFKAMMNDRWLGESPVNTRGALLLRTPYEYKNGLVVQREIQTLKSTFLPTSQYVNVHVYPAAYTTTMTKTSWGDALYKKFDDFVKIYDSKCPEDAGIDMVVTECGMQDIPKTLRADWLSYGLRRLLNHPRCRLAIGFTLARSGTLGAQFGLIDWNQLKLLQIEGNHDVIAQ